jgi:adenosylcobinamide kinase/adenosylcobinamide-phosphate guanylyltransferase
MTGASSPGSSRLILILGGARSGKSGFALALAERAGRRPLFVATAEALDEEMQQRIERHQDDRPDHWRTLEAPTGVGEVLRASAGDADAIVLDCLGFLVSNLMGDGEANSSLLESRVDAEIAALLDFVGHGAATLIVVSNEVGYGVVPAYPSGRTFRDALGRANQQLARAAGRVYWMMAGLPVEVKASGLAEAWETTHDTA